MEALKSLEECTSEAMGPRRIAILDECTSAVTMAMEQKLCAELRTGGCSCVTISHRPALVAVHHLNLALDGQGGFAIKELHQHAGVPGQQAEEEGDEEGRLLAQAPPASAAAENRRSPSAGSPPAASGGRRARAAAHPEPARRVER